MTNIQKKAICLACGENFEYDWTALALHISKEKKGHRKGKKWAANYLLKTRKLNQKRDLTARTPLTEEEKESKREMKRELSGEEERVKTYCPQCKTGSSAVLPIEHTQSPDAWKVKDRLVLMCNTCRS